MNYEKPDPLPKGWATKTIEEFVEDGRAIGYGVLKPGPHVEGGVRLIKSNQVQDGWVDLTNDYRISPELDQEFKRTRLSGGELLLNVVGSIGRSAIAPPELKGSNVSRAIAVLPLDKERVPWIQLFLSSPKCQADMFGRKVGIAQPVLNLGQVRQLGIPFPPIPEQRRIVAEIEKQFTRLEAGVAALRRVQANLKRYRAAVLKAACEGRLVPTETELQKSEGRGQKSKAKFETGAELLARILTERRQNWQGRGQYKEPVALDNAQLPQLPNGWTWATLDQIGQEGRPIIYGIIKPGPHIPDGVPYVRVTEMKGGRIDVPNLKRASRERAAKFARATLAPGDVLISKDGTIGRVAVVPPELAGGNITQHVMRAPIHAMMMRDFVVWTVRSDWCQHWLTGETRGVALRGVNVEDFRRLPIPIPPLAEQTRIVAEVERRLSVVEELESVVTANLQRATRLRQSILQKAFTGEILQGGHKQ
jgi:type I restriction enzyme, S subunit